MYGSYGYGGGYSALATSAGVGLLLGFLAFVAAIVVTVLFYKKFVAVDNVYKAPGLKRDWGPFFRFEHLIIENILKVLYIFTASLIAFESAAFIISSLFTIAYDPGATLVSIIVIAIVCLILEVLNRLWFEFSLLTVLIWKNTSAIRKSMGASESPSTGSGIGTPSNQPNAPQGGAPVGSIPQNPAYPQHPAGGTQPYAGATPNQPTAPVQPQPTQPVSDPSMVHAHTNNSQATGWTCPSCGAFNKSGAFCAQCGTRKNN